MKPIEETRPSLCYHNQYDETGNGTEDICYVEHVQKHTIDKAVLKEKLLLICRQLNVPYTELIEGRLKTQGYLGTPTQELIRTAKADIVSTIIKELGLEEE